MELGWQFPHCTQFAGSSQQCMGTVQYVGNKAHPNFILQNPGSKAHPAAAGRWEGRRTSTLLCRILAGARAAASPCGAPACATRCLFARLASSAPPWLPWLAPLPTLPSLAFPACTTDSEQTWRLGEGSLWANSILPAFAVESFDDR